MPKLLIVWITTNCGKLKEMGIPDHLTCLLRNLYAGQEATVRTRHGTSDWFQIGKGVHQGCVLLPCLFNLYPKYIMRDAELDEAQAGIKIAGRNINNLRYADDTTLMAESEAELKSLLMKTKEESKRVGLKLNIQKTNIMTSSPISSCEIDGETMETVIDFIFLVSRITADGDCSHEMIRCVLLGRKAMTNLHSILKIRHYLADKGLYSQIYGFSSSHVWMDPGGLQSIGLLRIGHDWAISLSLLCIGEGNGNPLQCSCLENPRDGGAWWAAVYGVAQSRTRLTRLSSSSSMYGCDNWTIKKAKHQRIDAFELWCWRRLLRVPWTARRSK